MKILVIVNEAPWGSTLGVTALRVTRALIAGGEQVVAVFFREEGVYHAQPGRAQDAGTPVLAEAWRDLSEGGAVPLLVCSSASVRRLSHPVGEGFSEAGLPRMMELLGSSDRVVTF